MSDFVILSFNEHIGIVIYILNIHAYNVHICIEYRHIFMHIIYLYIFMGRQTFTWLEIIPIAMGNTYGWMESLICLRYSQLNSSSIAREISKVLLNINY